jgi:hypothetical protein
LQIDQLWNIRMREDVMTAADTPQLKARRLGESAKFAKRNIGHIAPGEPLEELALIRAETVVTAWDGTLSSPLGSGPRLRESHTDHHLDRPREDYR